MSHARRASMEEEDCVDPTMQVVINLQIPSNDSQPVDYYKDRLMSAVAAMSAQNGASALEEQLCHPDANDLTVATNLDVTYTVQLSAAGAANLGAGCGTNASVWLTVPELANLRLPVKCVAARNGTLSSNAESAAASAGPGKAGAPLAVVIACSVLSALVLLVCVALGAAVVVRRRRRRKEELQQVR